MTLARLPRVRRLVDLGVPLSDIAGMTESDENVEQPLSTLDAEDTERGGVRPGTARRDAAGERVPGGESVA